MGLAKLTSGHIWAICAGLALVIGGVFWYFGMSPTSQNIATLNQRSDAAEQQLAKKVQNQKDLAKAKQEVAQVKTQFASYDFTLMPQPPIDLTKPTDETAMTKAMIRLWRQPYELCTAANRFARDEAKRDHVTLLSPPFSLAGQTTDPAAIPQVIIEFPMGQLQVAGTFQNVCTYARAWDHFKRVVALDGFQLAPGPNTAGGATVVGTATVTCYVFPHAPEGAQGGLSTTGAGGGPPGFSGPPGFGGPPGPKGGA
jgi:Tfp pilus assembly protein PilO